ncbi:MAG: helix-turn-helix transcriptional regulator [Rhodocyclaceae bacterium]|nr:helix-turn-helix transcriptional regulator [Rhodocyclaceae bacterium]
MSGDADSPCLTARQAAAYLRINEKKLYELANAREVPAARVGGKWLFPRMLLERWLAEQAHGGLYADRLLIGGAVDPLLEAAVLALGDAIGGNGLVACVPTSTGVGLQQLSAWRIDASLLHWGSADECEAGHAALLMRQRNRRDWTLVRLAWRDHGVMMRPGLEVASLGLLLAYDYRWALQAAGSGGRYGLQLALESAGFRLEDCGRTLTVPTARRAAVAVAMGLVDCAPGSRGLASEHGLGFLQLGVEALDLALPKGVFFRHFFRQLVEVLAGPDLVDRARLLGGYDLTPLGRVQALDD